jgi:hypothetical protein
VGGNGGTGIANSITGSSVTYGGGGGGGARTTAGTGGSGNGGAGAITGNGIAGTANRGGGGGGGSNTTSGTKSGGAGGTGIVIIRYPRYCLQPSPPTSAALVPPTLSWGAPLYVPSAGPVTSYTVMYMVTGTTGMNIYARRTSGTATSINITGLTGTACNTLNSGAGWNCLLGETFTTGQTVQFRVFARTATALGQMTATFNYVIP